MGAVWGVDVDEIDFRILEELQGNARLSNTELAVRVGLSPSPCWNRVRNLEKQGVIEKYVTIFNQGALGLPDIAMVYVTLEHHDDKALRSFEAALATLPEVMEAYLLTGDFDYFIKVAVASTASYERFLREKLYNDLRYQPHEDGVRAALLEAYVLGAPAAVDVARPQSAAVSAIDEEHSTIWCRAAPVWHHRVHGVLLLDPEVDGPRPAAPGDREGFAHHGRDLAGPRDEPREPGRHPAPLRDERGAVAAQSWRTAAAWRARLVWGRLGEMAQPNRDSRPPLREPVHVHAIT